MNLQENDLVRVTNKTNPFYQQKGKVLGFKRGKLLINLNNLILNLGFKEVEKI